MFFALRTDAVICGGDLTEATLSLRPLKFRKANWSNHLFDEDYICTWSWLYSQLRYTYPALIVRV